MMGVVMVRIDLLLTGILVASLLISGCMSAASPALSSQPVQPLGIGGPVEKVEIYHFHGNQQCASCIAVGNLAEKTVNENFKDELASGRLVFTHVNYDLPENTALATKYGVTGSSLWIGFYDANGFHKEENVKVWYLINNKDAYSLYLTDLINKRLNGDLS
jgi:hypothetical protein